MSSPVELSLLSKGSAPHCYALGLGLGLAQSITLSVVVDWLSY